MKEIDYYKNNEILENSYYQIPQELFINKLYKEKLNSDSKILYAFLLDRLSLSQKNHWFDSWQCNLPETFPSGSTINLSSFVLRRVNLLQSRKEDQNLYT